MGEQPANAVKAAEEKLHDEQLDWEDFCADKAELEEPVDESDRWVNIQRWVIEDLLDAARTEGRGEEPVAWRYRWNDRRYEDSWDYITNKQRSTFKHLQGDAAVQWEIQPLYASPIREPEISKPDRELAAREAFQVLHPYENWNDLDERYDPRGGYHPMQIKAFEVADAILNLAPVGGRGEEGSSRADLSPASRSPDQNSAGGEG